MPFVFPQFRCLAAAAVVLAVAGCEEPPAPVPVATWPQREDWKLPPEQHLLCKDKTGLVWTVPFAKARLKAETEHRLMLIKPSDFGAFTDGGW